MLTQPLTPKSAKYQNSRKIPNFILENTEKQNHGTMQKYDDEVSFEWSQHRILSTDLKVRTTVNVSNNRVKVLTQAILWHFT